MTRDPFSIPPPIDDDPPETSEAGGYGEAAIARARRHLDLLDSMTDWAMQVADAQRRRAVAEALYEAQMFEAATEAARSEVARSVGEDPKAPPPEPPPRPISRARDPAESFARATRVARLAMALQMTHEETILRLRQGPPAERESGRVGDVAVTGSNSGRRGAAPDLQDWIDYVPAPKTARPFGWLGGHHPKKFHTRINDGTRPEQVRDLVWDVINHEIDDGYQAAETLDALHERLIETETLDHCLYRPLKEGVEAVCADLGLKPDWSRWTGEGWTDPVSKYRWEHFWQPASMKRDRYPPWDGEAEEGDDGGDDDVVGGHGPPDQADPPRRFVPDRPLGKLRKHRPHDITAGVVSASDPDF